MIIEQNQQGGTILQYLFNGDTFFYNGCYYNKFSELGYKVALEDRFLFKEIAEVTVSLKNPKGKAREDENWRHLKADARKTFE